MIVTDPLVETGARDQVSEYIYSMRPETAKTKHTPGTSRKKYFSVRNILQYTEKREQTYTNSNISLRIIRLIFHYIFHVILRSTEYRP